MEKWINRAMEAWTWRHGDGYMDMKMEMSNGKLKPRRFSVICLPFAIHNDRRLLFFCFLTQKQAEVNRLQTVNKLNGLAHLWSSHKNTFFGENHFVNKIGIHRTLTSKYQKWIA
jgi:hypothetical protein